MVVVENGASVITSALELRHREPDGQVWAVAICPPFVRSVRLSCQWFVVASDKGAKQLTKNYTIFGQVTDGMDVVTQINQVPVDSNDKPVDPVTIKTVTIDETKSQS